DRIGQGGMGEVFEAHDESLRRRVALKSLHSHLGHDQRAAEYFQREAEVTGRLEHPGIVPIHSLTRTTDGRPCYSMRFVDGQTLQGAIRDLHDNGRVFTAESAVAFRSLLGRFVAVCNAVAYAHSRGVLHRDLKPENIMLGPFGET